MRAAYSIVVTKVALSAKFCLGMNLRRNEVPPSYVKTIGEEILYEYAKLISRSALGGRINYAFVSDRFKALRNGDATMSGTIREWQREQELPRACVYCGSGDSLQADHLIPKSRGGGDSADNMVLACGACNASRGNQGIFQWLGLKEKDRLNRIVAGKYLKQLYDLHEAHSTLAVAQNSVSTLCSKCRNGDVCGKANSVTELTCFCLESIF